CLLLWLAVRLVSLRPACFLCLPVHRSVLFFYHPTAAAELYTLSLHDALPISFSFTLRAGTGAGSATLTAQEVAGAASGTITLQLDRKSTRLNSSHGSISYAVFCLKKKKSQPNRGRVSRRTSA